MSKPNNPVEPPELGGYFTLRAIRSLLYKDDTLESITIQSKASGDMALVKIIPLSLGQYLSFLDPQETVFHVETFDKHAEVWLEFEWKESNQRLNKYRERSRIEREQADKYNRRLNELISLLPEQLGAEFNMHLARLALQELSITKCDRVMLALNIGEKLQQYREEDEQTYGDITKDQETS